MILSIIILKNIFIFHFIVSVTAGQDSFFIHRLTLLFEAQTDIN